MDGPQFNCLPIGGLGSFSLGAIMRTTALTYTCKFLGDGIISPLGWVHRTLTTGLFVSSRVWDGVSCTPHWPWTLELAMQLKMILNSCSSCFFLSRAWTVLVLREISKLFCRVALLFYTFTSDVGVTCFSAAWPALNVPLLAVVVCSSNTWWIESAFPC